jgi:hypothetical protein
MPRLRKWHQSCAILWSRPRRTCHRSPVTGNHVRSRSTDGECECECDVLCYPQNSQSFRGTPMIIVLSQGLLSIPIPGRAGAVSRRLKKPVFRFPSFWAQGKRSGARVVHQFYDCTTHATVRIFTCEYWSFVSATTRPLCHGIKSTPTHVTRVHSP